MKNLIILCLTIVSLSGCKKYEADESRMFQSPEKRIIGDWIVTSYLIDDVEYIDSLKSRWGICWGDQWMFTDESGLLMLTDSCYSLGRYGFPDKRRIYLLLSLGAPEVKSGLSAPIVFNNSGTFPSALTDLNHWKILQLDRSGLVLECTFFHTTQTLTARRKN